MEAWAWHSLQLSTPSISEDSVSTGQDAIIEVGLDSCSYKDVTRIGKNYDENEY